MNDKIITVYLDASADSIPVPDVPSSSTQIHVGSKVRALSRLPSSIPLTEPEQRVVQQALQSLSPDCAQYKAILQSVTMKNWLYSEKERWTEGCCDCPSFLISSFRVAEQNYGVSGNSQSMMAIAVITVGTMIGLPTLRLWPNCSQAMFCIGVPRTPQKKASHMDLGM